MERYYFFDSNADIGDRRLYSAADWSKVLSKFLENGIYNEGDNLSVTADGLGMAVKVGTGVAFINGRMYENDELLTLNIDAAEATLDRIDLVVLRLDLSEQNRFIRSFVVKGVPSAAPVAPVPQDSTFIKEIPLAEIRVTAAKSTIDQVQIADKRPADFVDPFVDGSRITTLENTAARADNVVPYTGATKNVDLNKMNLINASGVEVTRTGNDWFTRLDGIAGKGRLNIRNLADNASLADAITWTKDGILSFPKQSFLSISKGTDFAIASAVDLKLTPFAVGADNYQQFNAGTSEFIPKESGMYLINSEVMFTAVNPTITYLRLYEDGIMKDHMPKSYGERFMNGLLITNLIAGKKYTFYLYQAHTSSLTVDQVAIEILKLT